MGRFLAPVGSVESLSLSLSDDVPVVDVLSRSPAGSDASGGCGADEDDTDAAAAAATADDDASAGSDAGSPIDSLLRRHGSHEYDARTGSFFTSSCDAGSVRLFVVKLG